jgi:hypothetical protein
MRRFTAGVSRRFTVISAGVLLAVGVAAAAFPAAAANAQVFGFAASGYVACANGWPVVGVYVHAGGSSGWATLGAKNRSGQRPYGKGIAAHPTYTLSVGCGGSKSHWKTSNYAQGGLGGIYGNSTYIVSCNDRGRCSAVGFDGGIE